MLSIMTCYEPTLPWNSVFELLLWSNLISTTKHYDHRNRIKCKVNFYSISLLTYCKDVSSRVIWFVKVESLEASLLESLKTFIL